MGWGISFVIAVARTVAAWPGAVALLPMMPTWGAAAITLGGLWLCLWRRHWRVLGAGGLAAGLVGLTVSTTPDILIDRDGRLLGVRTADGGLALSSLRTAGFERRIWLQWAGLRRAAAWPDDASSDDGRLTCDPLGCIYRAGKMTVALSLRPEAIAEDCRLADVVVSTVPVRGRCPSASTVVDRFDLWRNGAHALWLRNGQVRVESVNGVRGNRPWVLRPAPGSAAAPTGRRPAGRKDGSVQ
jgi:competence protein ComEC